MIEGNSGTLPCRTSYPRLQRANSGLQNKPIVAPAPTKLSPIGERDHPTVRTPEYGRDAPVRIAKTNPLRGREICGLAETNPNDRGIRRDFFCWGGERHHEFKNAKTNPLPPVGPKAHSESGTASMRCSLPVTKRTQTISGFAGVSLIEALFLRSAREFPIPSPFLTKENLVLAILTIAMLLRSLPDSDAH